jgi:two-component system, response regulator PdtaR
MISQPKCIVVAEDEILIRMMAADALTDAGFEVVEANHAADVLAILNLRAACIHLLFTDIQMPGAMDGLKLAHHVRGMWPHIALLIVSGDTRPHWSALPVGSRFLTKPYHTDHVVTHVRELIAA